MRQRRSSKYRTSAELYHSLLVGRGVYEWRGEWSEDPIEQSEKLKSLGPVLVNIFSGEQLFAKCFDGGLVELEEYRRFVLNSIPRCMGLWPCDIIEVPESQEQVFGLFVRHEYTDIPTPKDRWVGRYALLFSMDTFPAHESAEVRLARIDAKNGWKSLAVRHMAVQITKAIERLNAAEYVYCDIHLSRFFFFDESCYLNFSNLVFPIDSLTNPATKVYRAPKRGEYPLEFAEPAYARGIIDAMDMRTQNYGLSALLFFLLLGRYAYDGGMMTHLHGDDLISHYNMLDACMETPVFIFDFADHNNELDANLQHDRNTQELWDALPSDLKHMFTTALVEDAALRRTDTIPTPRAWLKRFEEHGWVTE